MATFYHGSANEITEFKSSCIYAANSKNDAIAYIAGQSHGIIAEDCGNYGFLYMVEVSDSDMEIENDFDAFDCGAYRNPEEWVSNVVFNPESGYMFAKNAASLKWVLVEKIEITTGLFLKYCA